MTYTVTKCDSIITETLDRMVYMSRTLLSIEKSFRGKDIFSLRLLIERLINIPDFFYCTYLTDHFCNH